MAVYSILSRLEHNGDHYDFNGSLNTYLNTEPELDSSVREVMIHLLERYPDMQVCAGLKQMIQKDSSSTQFIQYKDIFKLTGKPLVYPYILYVRKGEEERGMLLIPDRPYGFIYARGYFLCITERGAVLNECRNEIAAISSGDCELVLKAFDKLFRLHAGILQKKIDSRFYEDYQDLKDQAVKAAELTREEAEQTLYSVHDKADLISKYVVDWFLLKKVVYVQYMVDKSILRNIHDGNVHEQRLAARACAAQIPFISYADMWRTGTKEERETAGQRTYG